MSCTYSAKVVKMEKNAYILHVYVSRINIKESTGADRITSLSPSFF